MSIQSVFLVIVVSTISATLTSALFIVSLQSDTVATEKNMTTPMAPVTDMDDARVTSNPYSPTELETESEVVVPADDLVKLGTPIEGISPDHQALVSNLDALFIEHDAMIQANEIISAEFEAELEQAKKALLDFVNNMESAAPIL